MKQIDDLIEHLKSDKPYDEIRTFKLWEALTLLNSNINTLNNSLINNLFDTRLEYPTGTINGVNTKFYLQFKPDTDLILGFKNGLLLEKLVDYNVKDKLITFVVAPVGGSILEFVYQVRREI